MLHGTLHIRAVHMATGLVREDLAVAQCGNLKHTTFYFRPYLEACMTFAVLTKLNAMAKHVQTYTCMAK